MLTEPSYIASQNLKTPASIFPDLMRGFLTQWTEKHGNRNSDQSPLVCLCGLNVGCFG